MPKKVRGLVRPVALLLSVVWLIAISFASDQADQASGSLTLLLRPAGSDPPKITTPNLMNDAPRRSLWATGEARETACYSMLAARGGLRTNRLGPSSVPSKSTVTLPTRP